MEEGHTVQGQDTDIVGNSMNMAQWPKGSLQGYHGLDVFHSQWAKTNKQDTSYLVITKFTKKTRVTGSLSWPLVLMTQQQQEKKTRTRVGYHNLFVLLLL